MFQFIFLKSDNVSLKAINENLEKVKHMLQQQYIQLLIPYLTWLVTLK
jgi:hypothetical protein